MTVTGARDGINSVSEAKRQYISSITYNLELCLDVFSLPSDYKSLQIQFYCLFFFKS